MDHVKKITEKPVAIYLLVLISLIVCLIINEWTLPIYLDADYKLLTATDLLFIRTINLGLICFSVCIFILRKNPSKLVNFGLLLGSLLVALLMTEVMLRAVNFSPGVVGVYSNNPSGQGSFRLQKNYVKEVAIGNGTAMIRTNDHGMHWENFSLKTTDKKQTIAFVGDSFTFGLWASDRTKGMVSIFDQALQDDNFRVLNFGVPGYGFEDILLQMKEVVINYKPQYLILISYMGNDLLDTYLGLQRQRVSKSGVLDFRQESLEGKIPEQYRRERKKSLTHALSKLYISRLINAVFGRYLDKQEIIQDNQIFDRKDYESNVFWSQSSYPAFAKKALEVSLDSLREIHQYCEENDIKLLLVALPSQEQVYYAEQFKVNSDYDIQLPQLHFKKFSTVLNIPYLDLLPHLQQWVVEHQSDLHYRFDGHFNDQGHEVSGQLIEKFFEENLTKADGVEVSN